MPGKAVDALRLQLEKAIAVQESLRGAVDDAVVDTTIASLKAQLASLEPPAQQRKLATILFMDIAGHTALTAHLDPEEQMAVVDPAIARLAAQVDAYGGHVARFQGDGFKAVFGLPVARENDPRQAVRAGLAIQREAGEIAREMEEREGLSGFQVRVGITTGLVFSGGETEGEDTIKGPAVNLAARLESAAEPGTVLISKDTFNHVRGSFEVAPLESIAAKGFSEPVEVYRVLNARPRSFYTRDRGIVGISTEMVGREAEIQALKDACVRAEQNPQVQVVTLVGEAGLGKSRLMFEFDRWLAGTRGGLRIFRGRCARETRYAPNSLLRDMLSSSWNVHEADSAATAIEKFRSGLREGLPENEEFLIKADFSSYFLGFDRQDDLHPEVLQSDPRQVRDRAVYYLIEYFETLTLKGPVVLLVEDLHWSDESSIDFLIELAQRMVGRALLVVVSARPSLYGRKADWGAGRTFQTRMTLQPLSRQDSQRLIEQIFRQAQRLPDRIFRLVTEKAEGNPFFLEEMINLLIEQGVIARQGETWSAEEGKLDNLPIPQTLTELLQARVDRLQPPERKLLQQASVIGRVFWDELLRVLWISERSAEDAPGIGDLLERLNAQAFIHRRESSAFETATEHAFKHDALHAVVYESVLLAHRRQYHASTAEWFIQQAGTGHQDQNGLIGEHLVRARDEARAFGYLLEAAASAARRYANEEALSLYDRILSLPEEIYEQHAWTLFCGREKALDFLGYREEQFTELSRMQAHADETADLDQQVEVGLRWLNYSEATREYPQELDTASRTLALAQQRAGSALEARAMLAMGRVIALRGGDLEHAKALIEAASVRFLELGEYRLAGHAQRALGAIHNMGNDVSSAIDHTRAALEYARKAQDRRGEGYALTNLAGLLNASGDWMGSQDILKQSHRLARKIGNRRGEAYILSALSSRAMRLGHYPLAEEYCREGLHLLRETGDQRIAFDLLINLSRLAHLRNAHQEAKTLLEEAEALGKKIQIRDPDMANLMDAYCEYFLVEGDNPQAAEYGRQAVRLRSSEDGSQQSMLSRAFLAAALLGAGNLAGAKEEVDLILKHGYEQPETWPGEEAPRMLLLCFKVLAASSDPLSKEILRKAHRAAVRLCEKIDSEPDQRAYLENVPWHKEIVELWQAQEALDRSPGVA